MAKLSTTSVFGDLLVDGMIHGNVTGNLTGNASTATSATTATSAGKWSTARTLTIGNTGKSVDGSGNQSWTLSEIGAFPSAGGTVSGAINLPATATSTNVNHPTQLAYGLLGAYGTLKILGNTDQSNGPDNEFVHIAAGWGLSPAEDKGIKVHGTYATCFGGTIYTTTNKPTPADIGAATASHGTHVTFGTTAPKVAGTAAVGSSTNVSREDHVHPAQTSVSGNAGTATTLQTARTLTIGNTGKTFNGSGNVSWTLAEIGAAASSHSHTSINYQDTRAVNTAAKDVPNGLSIHLKSNGTDGISDGGSYHPVLMMKPWGDKSGWPVGQLAVTQNNNLYFRVSSGADDTSWNAWKKVSLDGHSHGSAIQAVASNLTSVTINSYDSILSGINTNIGKL